MSSSDLYSNNFQEGQEDMVLERNFRTQLIINLNRRNPNRTLKDAEGENQSREASNNHLSFCIDNFPERKSSTETKVIKLKITIPKRCLRSTGIEKNVTSSKLTQTDLLFDNIDNAIKNEEDALENEFLPPHKSSQIFETEPQFKTLCDLNCFSAEDEEETGNLTTKSINYPPIMGRKALLAKIHAAKIRHDETLPDSEIIKLLVEERFQKFLRSYCERSSKRARRSVLLDNEESSHVTERNRLESKSDGGIGSSGTSSELSLNTSAYSISTQNSELTEVSKKTKCESLEEEEIFGKQDSCQDYLEYDAKEFLRDALGEDADVDSSVYLSKTLNETNSTFHSKHSTKNHSIGTSELSALLSKASSLHSSISKRVRRSVTSVFKQNPLKEERIKTPSVKEEFPGINNEKLAELARESGVQHQILLQTSKALNFCKSTKEFVSSREQVEAERILLAAACKREVIVKELHRLEFEEAVETDCKNLGTVTISRLMFPAKRREHQCQRRSKEFLQWSVCVASCGVKLFASDAVLPEENGSVCFADAFEFDRLPPDFEIHLALYSLRIKNSVRNYSHESKFHLNQDEKNTCPTPQKILNMHKDKSKSRIKEEPLIRTSSFTLWGRTTLRIADLFRTASFKLSNVPMCSNLEETSTMTVTSSVTLDERCSGFLNVGSESGDTIIWNRRWCCLHGHEMKHWNYPCEENVTEPISVLDLKWCVNSSISMADRASCPRSKTLLLETVTDEVPSKEPECSIVITRHFLNADTLEDMKNWENCLNAAIVSLRNWNATKIKSVFRRSAL